MAMPKVMPSPTRPSSPIQRFSNAYFRKKAVAKRISAIAAQPTQRRPIRDSSCAALSEGARGRGGSGSGATSGCGGGRSERPASVASIRSNRSSSRESLCLEFNEIRRTTIGSTIAVRTTAITINTRNRSKNESISGDNSTKRGHSSSRMQDGFHVQYGRYAAPAFRSRRGGKQYQSWSGAVARAGGAAGSCAGGDRGRQCWVPRGRERVWRNDGAALSRVDALS